MRTPIDRSIFARSVAAATVAAGTLITGLVVAPPADAADSPGCVSRIEYRNVKHGMSKTNVHARFDAFGKQTSQYTIGGNRYQTREYKPCTDRRYGFVFVDYKNGNVIGKYVYWG